MENNEDVYAALKAINDTLESRLSGIIDRLIALEEAVLQAPTIIEQKLDSIDGELGRLRRGT